MLIFHGAGYANGQWSYSDTHIYIFLETETKCDANNICQYQQMSSNEYKNVKCCAKGEILIIKNVV